MSDWNSELYLKFKQQRTQPAIDLANRLKPYEPASIVDIGCGPGNSTSVLHKTFPKASILGIDSSPNMIEKASQTHPELTFSLCSAQSLEGEYDALFSNACLQWIPDHRRLIPQLMERLVPGGVLAVQVPMNEGEPLYQIIREVAEDPKWDFQRVHFEVNETLKPEDYFDILSGCCSSFELWETVYCHQMPSHASLVEWVKGTRLRPYLDALAEQERAEFEGQIIQRVADTYPVRKNHQILFHFRRFFFLGVK